jgi:hypothetical protein
MLAFLFRSGVLVISVLVLAACGGGGGGGGGGPSCTIATGSPVTVQGSVKYERVATQVSGALNYASISQLAVRGATVELVSCDTVLATTQTGPTGQFSFFSAPGNSSLMIRVRAELKQTSSAAQWDVTVRDNTNGDALYTLSSTFNSGAGSTQNLLATTGWTGSSYAGVRSAGPFAILDTIHESQQKVLQANASTVFPTLQVFWSINNSTASGDFTLGNIGTSFFSDSTNSRRLYILGRQNDDTDEYDASVVAHEWGHYYQSAFSRDDSMGGRHGGGDDRLDRRIAFSEGWGNAWSGIVLAQSSYTDSNGPSQGSGFALALNTGYASTGPKGWFREQSIQYILWDLNRQAGFASLHSSLTSSSFRMGAPLSDIHSFAAAYRSSASGTPTTALNALLAGESISNNSDEFGSNESNNGGSAATLPYYRQVSALGNPVTFAAGQTVCVSAAFAGTNDFNKLGLYAYVRFTTPAAGSRIITVSTVASGVDADFEVHSAGSRVLLAETALTTSETASVNLMAGEHVLVVYDFNKVAGTPCFTISIQ